MTTCTRCGRRLKAPTETGMGPKCALYVLGSKPKREPTTPRQEVKRDDRTADLFPAESRIAEWFASAPSLEML